VLHATRAIDVYTHGGFFKIAGTARDNKKYFFVQHFKDTVQITA
jgi:hypothetical protein